MPKLKRTPPSTPQIEVQRCHSNPNIPETANEPEFINFTKRMKRPRSESTPSSELSEFKEEIREMLAKWNGNQESTLKKIMSKITAELSEIKAQNEEIKRIKAEIEESASLMSIKYEEMKSRMVKLETERSEQHLYINQLEKKIQDVQECQRSSTIELRNIPIKKEETYEDLIKIISDTGNALNIQVEQAEVRDVYRMQSKQGPTNQIIFELCSVTKKHKMLQAARQFNKGKSNGLKLNSALIGLPGESAPVYISDRLPFSSRQLFHQARKFAKSHNFSFCWISYGKIFLRKKEGDKPVRIISEKTLTELLEKQS